MRLTNMTTRRAVLFAIGATALALTSVPGQAKSKAACPVDDSGNSAWVLVDNTSHDAVCVKPGVEWGKYTRFQFEPSSYAPSNEDDVLKEEDVKKLTAFLDAKLQSSYRDQGVSEGPAIRVKPTITGVRRSRSGLNAIGLVLVKMPLSYGGAAVRFDLIDDNTGETIGIVSSTRRGRPWNSFQGLRAFGHSRVVLNGSAKRMKHDTDLLRSFAEQQRPSSQAD